MSQAAFYVRVSAREQSTDTDKVESQSWTESADNIEALTGPEPGALGHRRGVGPARRSY